MLTLPLISNNLTVKLQYESKENSNQPIEVYVFDCNFLSSITTISSQQMDKMRKDLNQNNNNIIILSTFAGCVVQVTNFHGLNINLPILTNPILLLRHISFPDNFLIYPCEWRLSTNLTATKWFAEINWSRFF